MAYPGQGFSAAGSGSMVGGTTATNLASTVREDTVASYLSDAEDGVRRLEELVSKLGAMVDQVNGGCHRPPAVPPTNVKNLEDTRTSMISRVRMINRRLRECDEQFEFELKALFEQLPQ